MKLLNLCTNSDRTLLWQDTSVKNKKSFGSVNLPLLTSPVRNLKSSGGHPASRKKGLCDLLSLTPLLLSVMLLGHHGNRVAIEVSCLAGEWGHMTNVFLFTVSSYMWFLHVLGESRRQNWDSKLRLLLIYIYIYILFQWFPF